MLFVHPSVTARRFVDRLESADPHAVLSELKKIGFKPNEVNWWPILHSGSELKVEATVAVRTWSDVVNFRRRLEISVWPTEADMFHTWCCSLECSATIGGIYLTKSAVARY
jgi:hypothetical protein